MIYFFNLALVLLIYMSLWFILSLFKKRNDVADIAWGLGFVLISWVSFFIGETPTLRGIIVCLLVSIWGLRLAWHIHKRNRSKEEDYRYLKWRQEWGKWFYIRSYFQVYFLQGIFLFLISLPVIYINRYSDNTFGVLDIVGIVVWIIGFYFEAVGDWQLSRFIKNPDNKGKLMQEGLWAYTRHPNYFGEVTQWWGIWLVALSVPNAIYSIVGPITITFLILKVSGIPMLEKKMELKPDFAEYKRKTSMFFPFFHK